MQRQSTLKDIESLRYRENELRMRMEAFEKYDLSVFLLDLFPFEMLT